MLPLPKDLPAVIAAETERLTFFTSPLSSKGLLTAQTREALRFLIVTAGKTGTIVKLQISVRPVYDESQKIVAVEALMSPLPAGIE